MLSRSLVCFLVFAAFAIANGKITIFTPTDWDTVEQDALPRRMTEKEQAMYPDYLAAAQAAAEKMTQASNSSASLRMVAEFEPMQAVLVRYPLGLPASLIALFSKDVRVYCLCTSSYQSSATTTFQSAGVVMSNVTFLNYATDSYWTRDFGPWWTITDGKTGIGGFTYNRPRPNDSKIPKSLSTYFNVPYTSSSLVHTGGNMMADGLGVAASTTLVYKENPSMSQTQVNDNMKANWGIQTYETQADPTGNYIEHIDCWGKFLSTTDVLIDKFATSSSYYQKMEDVANWFAKQKNGAGVTWTVHRVNVKGSEAYSNSLILNKHVYVPISGSSADDNAALAVYQAAMPGYDIVGVTQASSTPWENTDALHCRTNGIPYFS